MARDLMKQNEAVMKKTYLFIALSSLAFACAAQPANENQVPSQASPDMQQMQGRMQDMEALMDRIHKTQNPQERQRLMSEHMQSMQQSMTRMGQMMHAQGDAPVQGHECAHSDTECRMQRMQGQQQMTNQHMGMMQMMMEQMMGQMMQRDAEPAAKPADPENHEAHH
jgi:hypothetical protein